MTKKRLNQVYRYVEAITVPDQWLHRVVSLEPEAAKRLNVSPEWRWRVMERVIGGGPARYNLTNVGRANSRQLEAVSIWDMTLEE